MAYHKLLGRLFGSVYLKLYTNNEKQFLSICQRNKLVVWDIKRMPNEQLSCYLYLFQFDKIEELKDEEEIKIDILEKKVNGILPLVRARLKSKTFVIMTSLSMVFLLLISNIVWSVNITGVNIEQKEKINQYLQSVGIKQGNFIFKLPKSEQVEADILLKMDELLYLSIEENGTKINVEAKEKKQTKPKLNENYKQLVAKKSGLIDKMLIKHGFSLVQANDYVNKGEVLVVSELNDEEKQTDEVRKPTLEKVEGEVYANTWYEVSISTPLTFINESLQEKLNRTYYMKVNNKLIPLWPLKKQKLENHYTEIEETDLRFLSFHLPFKLIKQDNYVIKTKNIKQSTEVAKEYAIQQAVNHLQLKVGNNSKVKHYFILEESVQNNKVVLTLFMSVSENIAEGK